MKIYKNVFQVIAAGITVLVVGHTANTYLSMQKIGDKFDLEFEQLQVEQQKLKIYAMVGNESDFIKQYRVIADSKNSYNDADSAAIIKKIYIPISKNDPDAYDAAVQKMSPATKTQLRDIYYQNRGKGRKEDKKLINDVLNCSFFDLVCGQLKNDWDFAFKNTDYIYAEADRYATNPKEYIAWFMKYNQDTHVSHFEE